MDDIDVVDEGRRIAAFLQDAAVIRLLADLRDRAISRWEMADDRETREEAWHDVKALRALQAALRGLVGRAQQLDAREGR